jgi:hypothetical protein
MLAMSLCLSRNLIFLWRFMRFFCIFSSFVGWSGLGEKPRFDQGKVTYFLGSFLTNFPSGRPLYFKLSKSLEFNPENEKRRPPTKKICYRTKPIKINFPLTKGIGNILFLLLYREFIM